MKQVLEIFQGRSPLTAQKASINTMNKPNIVLLAQRIAIATTTNLALTESSTIQTPPTTIPTSTVLQKTVGVVPPDDPTCR
jgi:hypothetical protein